LNRRLKPVWVQPLDGFPPPPVGSLQRRVDRPACVGESEIPDPGRQPASGEQRDLENFERLDRLVRSLLERYSALQAETSGLRSQLEERDARVRALEEQVLEMNQVRQDVGKRLDDLITQIDHLDAQVAGSGD